MNEPSMDVSDVLAADRDENPWLSAEDVIALVGMGGSLPVTIDGVTPRREETFEQGRKEIVRGLVFTGKTKKLVLNKTNARALARAYGRDMAAWKGKRIQLYAEKLPRPAFGKDYGIRVRVK